MKKNIALRVASGLTMACLLTTCVISGTFAKYTTAAGANDTARVAKWGVGVEVKKGEIGLGLAKEYKNEEKIGDEEIGATVSVQTNTGDNLLAPGTAGTVMTASISGTPEVAVRVTVDVDLKLTGWKVDGNEYCPIVFSVGNGVDAAINYTKTGTVAELETAVENAVIALLTEDATVATDAEGKTKGVVDYVPNTNLGKSVVVNWKWEFEVEGNDDKDTELGDLADEGSAPTMSFTMSITVEQLN